jgi:hypothetical protein
MRFFVRPALLPWALAFTICDFEHLSAQKFRTPHAVGNWKVVVPLDRRPADGGGRRE